MHKLLSAGLTLLGSVLTICLVTAPSATAPSAAAAERPTHDRVNGSVTVTDLAGWVLPRDPVLTRSDRVIIAVAGFTQDGPVQMWMADQPGDAPGAPTLRADEAGNVRIIYSIPPGSSTGEHVLVLSGSGPSVPAPAAAGNGALTIAATVPNAGIFHYQVAP